MARVSLYDTARDVVRSVYDARIDTPAVLDTDHYFPAARKFVDRWQEIRDEALDSAKTPFAADRLRGFVLT